MSKEIGENSILLNNISIVIDGDEVGFSMNCKNKNIIMFWKAEELPLDMLQIISQRLTEDIGTIVNSTVELTKTEDMFNNIVAKVVCEESVKENK